MRERLADFFSSLLAGDGTSILRSGLNNLNGHNYPVVVERSHSLLPFAMPTVGIDVAGLSNIDERLPQALAQRWQTRRSEWVVRTGDYDGRKPVMAHRHQCKPTCLGRKACTLRIGDRHEKRTLRNQR